VNNPFSLTIVIRDISNRKIILSVAMGLFHSALSIIWPLLIYRSIQPIPEVIDAVLYGNIAAIVVFFSLAQWLAFKQTAYNYVIVDEACLRLSSQLYEQFSKLQWQEFKKHNRAYFYDLIMADFWRVRQGVNKLFDSALTSVIIILAMLGFIAWINLVIFVFSLLGMALIVVLGLLTNRRTRPLLVNYQASWRQQHEWAVALLDKFELLKMNRGISATAQDHRRHTGELLDSNTRMLRSELFWRSWVRWASNFLRIGMLFLGAYLTQTKQISAQDFVISLLVLSIIQSNVAPLSAALFSFMDGQEAAKTLQTFFNLATEAHSTQGSGGKSLHSISLNHVCFSYGTKNIFDGKDIHLRRGKLYLWKGANGAGKSTMARILLGHLSPTRGNLLINERSAHWHELEQWRSHAALIDQHVTLFGGTIKENALFGHDDPSSRWQDTDDELKRRLLPKHKNPDTYDVGERGDKLSGGEARRIALLRELLISPGLLVLDEPTNHMDKASIIFLKEIIHSLKLDKIIIIISHLDDFDDIADETVGF
jgi:ABC-type multidrug transport system fused ATPase/permease subunit